MNKGKSMPKTITLDQLTDQLILDHDDIFADLGGADFEPLNSSGLAVGRARGTGPYEVKQLFIRFKSASDRDRNAIALRQRIEAVKGRI